MLSRLAGLMMLVAALWPAAAVAAPGDVDSSFGAGGKFSPNIADGGLVAGDKAPDGSLIVAGTQINTTTGPQVLVAKVKGDGSGLDTAFGDGKGYATYSLTPEKAPDTVAGVDVAADGSIFVGGRTFQGGDSRLFVAKLDPFGDLVDGFGAAGVSLLDMAGTFAEDAGDLVLDGTGKPVLSGSDDTDFLVVRLDEKTGQYDTTFDGDGIVRGTGVAGAPDGGTGLAASGGSIFVGGLAGGPMGGASVIKLGSSGAMDSSYGTGTNPGVASFSLGTKGSRLNDLTVLGSGEVGFGGAGTDVEGGDLQPAFGTLTPQGQVRYIRLTTAPVPPGQVRGVFFDPMGGLISSGTTGSAGDGDFFSLAANADGSPNTAFGDGGGRVYPAEGDQFGGRVVFDLERGRYVVVGDTFVTTLLPTLFAIKLTEPTSPPCKADAVIESVRLLGPSTFGEADYWEGQGQDKSALFGGGTYRLEVVFTNAGPDPTDIRVRTTRVVFGDQGDDTRSPVLAAPVGKQLTVTQRYEVRRDVPTTFRFEVELSHACDEPTPANNKRERVFIGLAETNMLVQSGTDLILGRPTTIEVRTGSAARRSAATRPVTAVHLAVLRRTKGIRPAARRCHWLKNARARFVSRRATGRRCLRPKWIETKRSRGNRNVWLLPLKRGLPDGNYVLYSRATYKGGARTRVFTKKRGNRGTFRVKRP